MRIGRYALLRRVGTGGMAEVWKSLVQGPAGFEKVVAIKRILPHLVARREFVDMFVAEAKLVARLVHPNIVQVFDFGEAEGLSGSRDYFICMEYVDGQDLSDVLHRLYDRRGQLPTEVALFVAWEVAKALAYAHGEADLHGRPLEIVHRDISPHNILVSYRGEVKVTDFGIAKVASALPLTRSGMMKGKLGYLSPEQAKLEPLDGRSDVFTLGLVLLEMLTGRRLFSGPDPEVLLGRIRHFDGPGDADLDDVPDHVRPILRQALAADPGRRYDAGGLERALANALGASGATTSRDQLSAVVQELFAEERRLQAPGIELEIELSEPGGTEISGPQTAELAEPDWAAHLGDEPRPATTIGKPSSPAPPPSVWTETRVSAPRRRRPTALLAFAGVLLAVLATDRLLDRASAGEAAIAPALASATKAESPSPTPTMAVATPALALSTPTPVPAPTVIVKAAPRKAAPASRRTVAKAPPRKSPKAVAIATPSASMSEPSGWLTVQADPWVEVWIDGARVSTGDPVNRRKLKGGRYELTLLNARAKFEAVRHVTIDVDRETRIFVDVAGETVVVDGRVASAPRRSP